MNREIKFRAWNSDDNKMENPLVIAICDGGIMKPLINCSDGNRAYKDYPLMQFTGLFDKNGKEIYEGDILRVFNWGVTKNVLGISRIEWDIDENGWGMSPDFTDGDRYDLFRKNYEVIGNIYENPELLEK